MLPWGKRPSHHHLRWAKQRGKTLIFQIADSVIWLTQKSHKGIRQFLFNKHLLESMRYKEHWETESDKHTSEALSSLSVSLWAQWPLLQWACYYHLPLTSLVQESGKYLDQNEGQKGNQTASFSRLECSNVLGWGNERTWAWTAALWQPRGVGLPHSISRLIQYPFFTMTWCPNPDPLSFKLFHKVKPELPLAW